MNDQLDDWPENEPPFNELSRLVDERDERIKELETAIAHAMLALQAGGNLTTPQEVASQSRYALETINAAWGFLYETNVRPAKSYEDES